MVKLFVLLFALIPFSSVKAFDLKLRQQILDQAEEKLKKIVSEIDAKALPLAMENKKLKIEIEKSEGELSEARKRIDGNKTVCNDKSSLKEKLACHAEADKEMAQTNKSYKQIIDDAKITIGINEGVIKNAIGDVLYRHFQDVVDLHVANQLLLNGNEFALSWTYPVRDSFKAVYDRFIKDFDHKGIRIINAEVEATEKNRAVLILQTTVYDGPQDDGWLVDKNILKFDSNFGQDLVRVEVKTWKSKEEELKNFGTLPVLGCLLGRGAVEMAAPNYANGNWRVHYGSLVCETDSAQISLLQHTPLWKFNSAH